MKKLTNTRIIEIKHLIGNRAFKETLSNRTALTHKASDEIARKYLRKGNTLKATEDAIFQLSQHLTQVRLEKTALPYRQCDPYRYQLPTGSFETRMNTWIQSLVETDIRNLLHAAHYGDSSVERADIPDGRSWKEDGGQYSSRCTYEKKLACFDVKVAKDWYSTVCKTKIWRLVSLTAGVLVIGIKPVGDLWEATWLEKAVGTNFRVVKGFLIQSLHHEHHYFCGETETATRAKCLKYERKEALELLGWMTSDYLKANGHTKIIFLERISGKLEQYKDVLRPADIREIRKQIGQGL